MRRGIGVQRQKIKKTTQQAFDEKGKELTEAKLSHIKELMEKFKQSFEKFTVKNKRQINKNPEFRAQFQLMCNKLGVDPLASNRGYIYIRKIK